MKNINKRATFVATTVRPVFTELTNGKIIVKNNKSSQGKRVRIK